MVLLPQWIDNKTISKIKKIQKKYWILNKKCSLFTSVTESEKILSEKIVFFHRRNQEYWFLLVQYSTSTYNCHIGNTSTSDDILPLVRMRTRRKMMIIAIMLKKICQNQRCLVIVGILAFSFSDLEKIGPWRLSYTSLAQAWKVIFMELSKVFPEISLLG